MIFDSAPNDKRISSLDDADQPQGSSAGADASEAAPFSNRLARGFNISTFLGYSGGILAIFTILVPMKPFYAAGAAAYVFFAFMIILAIMTSIVRKGEEANDLCDERWSAICKLHSEINHLEQDVEHWKALCFAERGGLEAAEGAAAGNSRSENQEGSAAVVKFPTNDGAA